jgi:hypothetical protein
VNAPIATSVQGAGPSRSVRWPLTRDVARRIGVAAALLFALTGGGRIVGSDELAMFELSRAMLRGNLAVPEGATLEGPDGRHYTKNAAAQAVIALPWVAAVEGAVRAAPIAEHQRELAERFGISFFNAVVTAILLAVFYTVVRRMEVGPRSALAATVLLGASTPLWVYAKSFMAEPLQAIGLLLALAGCAGVGAGRAYARPERMAGLGVFLAVSVKLSMLPLALACMTTLIGQPARAWRTPLLGLALALIGHGIYNVARFGTPFETGYGAQATATAYTTPIWVGLYGLLLSSGKGVLWFAPALWLALPIWLAGALPFAELRPSSDPDVRVARGWGRAAAAMTPVQRIRFGSLAVAVAALLLYGRFQHWAGDGSFGPRYLIPVLPLAFLIVALALERGGRTVRRWAWGLGVFGALVQFGGVGVYFGAQMREAGDYPYTLPLEHPRFMSDSHFNPRFTPIVDHWRMLIRNGGEYLRGEGPALKVGGGAEPATAGVEPTTISRIGVGAEDQDRLLHALDFWWAYLAYAGFAPWPPVLAAFLLAVLTAWAWGRAAHAARREAQS